MKKIIFIFTIIIFISCEKEVLVEQEIKVSLINIIPETSGNCSNGGYKIETGIDTDNNGILDTNEVQSTNYICNGNDGVNGLNSSLNIIEEPIGDNCLNGGFKIETGIDADNNGILDPDEIQSTNYICNGNDGVNGLNSLLNIVEEPIGDNCLNGGYKIETGIDTNNNGTLEISEVQSTNYICNRQEYVPLKNIETKYNIEMFASGGQSLNVAPGASSNLTDWKNIPTFRLGNSLHARRFNTQIEKDNFFGTGFILMENNNIYEQFPPVTASTNTILSLLASENKVDVNNFGYQMMPFTWGVSGNSITTMEKGTTAYNNFMECVTKAKEFANKEGKTFGVRSMNWYHGEADRNKSKQWYYDKESQLFIDVNNDVKLITGQIEDVQFFTYQTSPWIGRDLGSGAMTQMNIQEAQLQVVRDFSNVHLCGAMYQFEYADFFHPKDNAVIGLQTGVAMKRVLLDNETWNDFIPLSHKVITDGTKFYTHLKFGVPTKPMRFDESGDLWHNPNGKQPNFGFEILDNNIEQQSEEPFIVNGDTVVLTTSSNPTGMTIRYAVNGHAGGGNLCDSQNIIIKNKNIYYVIDNFAAGFSEYVID